MNLFKAIRRFIVAEELNARWWRLPVEKRELVERELAFWSTVNFHGYSSDYYYNNTYDWLVAAETKSLEELVVLFEDRNERWMQISEIVRRASVQAKTSSESFASFKAMFGGLRPVIETEPQP